MNFSTCPSYLLASNNAYGCVLYCCHVSRMLKFMETQWWIVDKVCPDIESRFIYKQRMQEEVWGHVYCLTRESHYRRFGGPNERLHGVVALYDTVFWSFHFRGTSGKKAWQILRDYSRQAWVPALRDWCPGFFRWSLASKYVERCGMTYCVPISRAEGLARRVMNPQHRFPFNSV